MADSIISIISIGWSAGSPGTLAHSWSRSSFVRVTPLTFECLCRARSCSDRVILFNSPRTDNAGEIMSGEAEVFDYLDLTVIAVAS